MSYEVCIWDPARHAPLPATAADAVATFERLDGVADTWNSTLGDFGIALAERHDAGLTMAQPGAGGAAYWGADPRESTATCRTAIYRMALPGDDWSLQMVQVVELAAAHGLVVLDNEMNVCFLPDGSVFPDDMREVWTSERADLLAGPRDPSEPAPDSRTWLQWLAGEVFDAIGRGNKSR